MVETSTKSTAKMINKWKSGGTQEHKTSQCCFVHHKSYTYRGWPLHRRGFYRAVRRDRRWSQSCWLQSNSFINKQPENEPTQSICTSRTIIFLLFHRSMFKIKIPTRDYVKSPNSDSKCDITSLESYSNIMSLLLNNAVDYWPCMSEPTITSSGTQR
jgi:hypothetical protein